MTVYKIQDSRTGFPKYDNHKASSHVSGSRISDVKQVSGENRQESGVK